MVLFRLRKSFASTIEETHMSWVAKLQIKSLLKECSVLKIECLIYPIKPRSTSRWVPYRKRQYEISILTGDQFLITCHYNFNLLCILYIILHINMTTIRKTSHITRVKSGRHKRNGILFSWLDDGISSFIIMRYQTNAWNNYLSNLIN